MSHLIAVEEIPGRGLKGSKWDEFIEEMWASEMENALVDPYLYEGKNLTGVQISMKTRIKAKGYEGRLFCHVRKDRLYLSKVA